MSSNKNSEYKLGDIVNLKCGGPAMVVAKVMFGEGDGWHYEIVWHDQVNCMQREILPEAALEEFTSKEAWEQ